MVEAHGRVQMRYERYGERMCWVLRWQKEFFNSFGGGGEAIAADLLSHACYDYM